MMNIESLNLDMTEPTNTELVQSILAALKELLALEENLDQLSINSVLRQIDDSLDWTLQSIDVE